MGSEEFSDKTILVVDDESVYRGLLQTILMKEGFGNVVTAANGADALAALGLDGTSNTPTPTKIDIAILDVFLPDTNGFAICEKINDELEDYIPVLLISGHSIDNVRANLLDSGGDDYLSKPFEVDDLMTRIRILLRRQSKFRNKLGSEPQPEHSVIAHPHVDDMIGPYVVEECLAWGGAATLFRVKKAGGQQGRSYVIKMLARHASPDDSIQQRFHREMGILKELEHPNIVRILDEGEFNERPYYVMELIEGDNLEHLIAIRTEFSSTDVLHIGQGLGEALHCIHLEEVIHRDVSPKNVMISHAQEVKLTDFGIAAHIGDMHLTSHGHIVGTPLYMAPEQFKGEELTQSTDIYSYGAVLYHLITGNPPFYGANTYELAQKHMTKKLLPIRSYRPAVPESWEEFIVHRCLAKKATDRPGSMQEIRTELETLKDALF